MLYVGVDISSKWIEICVLNSQAEVVQRKRVRQVDQMMRMLEGLADRMQICYEVSCGYGRFHDLFAEVAERVVAAHPGHLRLIFRSKRKNDRHDAQQLAKLLLLDLVPRVHVPAPDVRAWRELITFRRRLVEKRTCAKNAIRALLRSVGLTAPKRPGLWTQQGLDWLRRQSFSQWLFALKRDVLLQQLETLSAQIERVEGELARFSKDNAAVWQLKQTPGVGQRTAEAVVAFLDDPHRFKNSKAIGAYFGLVPCQDQSGNTNRLGHITREGCATVRHLLIEAAWQASRRSPTIKAYFERIQRNDPDRKKIAVVATAHYLARVMWAMLKNGTLWKETISVDGAA